MASVDHPCPPPIFISCHCAGMVIMTSLPTEQARDSSIRAKSQRILARHHWSFKAPTGNGPRRRFSGSRVTADSILTRTSCFTRFVGMKNVTITLNDQVAQWVRVLAARRATSVSRLVGDLLRDEMARDEAYEASMQQYLSREPVALKREGPYPSREELHER